MDINGTRYHLLLNVQDWARCQEEQPSGLPVALSHFWLASPPKVTDLAWDWEQNELTLQPSVHLYLPRGKKGQRPDLDVANRRGAACDRYGNWYWIDSNQVKIRVLSSGSGQVSDFWPPAATPALSKPRPSIFQPQKPHPAGLPGVETALSYSGLTVTQYHYLVVGVLKPAGLLVFDLHAGGPPQQLLWPKGVDFFPFDMAPMPGGGVWILDRDNHRYWGLDRNFTVMNRGADLANLVQDQADPFQPRDAFPGSDLRQRPPRIFPPDILEKAAYPVAASDPVAIEALPDGTVLILDPRPKSQDSNPQFSRVFRYQFDQQLGPEASTQVLKDILETESAKGFCLNAHDFAFLPEHTTSDGATIPDRLYLVSQTGDQAFDFDIKLGDQGQLVLQPIAEYLPMRLFGGKAIATANGQVYYDSGERWLPLVPQERPRYRPEAALQTALLDGKQPGTVWHRLMLDAAIPAGSEVHIWSRAADEESDLSNLPWQFQPDPYRRSDGTELPFAPVPPSRPYIVPGQGASVASSNDGLPSTPTPAMQAAQGRGTWELLFQATRGRYLQLRLVLKGDGIHSPRIRACRVYYPRFSYTEHYLPGVYRRDDASASFLERYLANMEGFYTTLEDRLAALPALLDVRSAPAETLDWLAGWFGVVLDPSWDETRRRLFIRNAMLFFQYRGTVPGLLMALQLTLVDPVCEDIFSDPTEYTDRPGGIRIVERYRTRQVSPTVYGDPSETTPVESSGTSWQPGDGAGALHDLYGKTLTKQGLDATLYPIVEPVDPYRAAWRSFSRQVLGFVPSAGPKNQSDWQEFLAVKYGTLAPFQNVYGVTDVTADFTKVPLLAALPQDEDQLLDWYTFEANFMCLKNNAHRFTVLLPLKTEIEADSPEYSRRLGLAQRIIELEKPAHTGYEIRFYWAMFRLGEARLGSDTVIDRGGRDPRLNPPLILGQGHLSESHLAPRHPQDQTDRLVLGNGYGL